MDQKELEEQLQAFFEHNPLDDDMVYLKQFVKEHPENKLSWYLLGKEYALRGKQGKARYCFAQAGEVYEAFEKKRVRLGLLEELRAEEGTTAGSSGKRKRIRLAAKLGAAVLVALLAGSYFLTGDGRRNEAEPVNAAESGGTAAEESTGDSLRILYSDPLAGRGEEPWKRLLQPGQAGKGKTLVVEGVPTSDGKWINGLRVPSLLVSAESSPEGNSLKVDYLQKASCNCTPVENKEAEAEVSAWFKSQEQDVILRSLVKSYQSKYGQALPETLDGIIRNFPDNLLPGYTDQMKEAYAALRSGLQASAAGSPQATAQPSVAGSPSGAGGKPSLFSEPLEIIVDRKNYRLALVSGGFILRSYPVGLGGDRTPEGVFTITDKVKNPNGRDDGDFGSRGMQLSDTDYAIHGTKEPRSIGEDRSLGCIRMLKADVEELFDMVPMGTKVTIGRGLLPEDILKNESPFKMPAMRQESNPGKIYRWL